MILKQLIASATAILMIGTNTVLSENGMLSITGSSSADKSRVSVHDPSIFKDTDDTYYAFGSHIDAAKTSDLQNWSTFTNGYAVSDNKIFGNLSDNLSKAFEWAGENLEDCENGFAVWAPDVIYNADYINKDGTRGAYLMYFCTSSTYMRSVIGFAASKTVTGPYEFVDTLIYSGFTPEDSYVTSSTKNVNKKYTSTNVDELIASGEVSYNDNWFSNSDFNNNLYPNAIDPTVYTAADGKMYMCYGSWSGGIFTLELDKTTGKCIHPKTGTTEDGRMIDSYFGTKISGGYRKSGEGPYIKYNPDNGYYYLWITYGGLLSDGGYNMRVFRSENPIGPFYDASGNTAVLSSSTNLDSVGLKVMGNYKFSNLNTAYMSCGHNSALRDDNGNWYLVYHARFDDNSEYHELRVHSMYFNEDDWPVVSPYEYSGDSISEYGYEVNDIIGEYEYINHGYDTSSDIHSYSNITLTADGKITGAVNGTWIQEKGSSSAVFNIDGVEYKGYFIASKNETGKTVMSFSATGNNNQTVWGAKTTEFSGSARSALVDFTDFSNKIVYNTENLKYSETSVNIGNTSLLSGVTYYITNKNSGLLLDADGSNIRQWEKKDSPSQQWRIIAEKDGYCRIVSAEDESKCAAVTQSSKYDGVNIELQTYSGADNQLWKLIIKGGSYSIVSKCSQDSACMDVYEWSTENGGDVKQWNNWGGDCQKWNITPVCGVVPDGEYLIKNINSAMFVSESNGTAMQHEINKKIAWNLKQLEDGRYIIRNDSGKALTVQNASAENGADITVSEFTGDNSQKFTLQCNKDGSYTLLSEVSDGKSCMDVYEISIKDGANICQWRYWGGNGQKFVLYPIGAYKEYNENSSSVKESSSIIESSLIAESSSESEINITLGDVNSDSYINTVDALEVLKYVVGLKEFSENTFKAADVDHDGNITSGDALMILKKVVGLIDKF